MYGNEKNTINYDGGWGAGVLTELLYFAIVKNVPILAGAR